MVLVNQLLTQIIKAMTQTAIIIDDDEKSIQTLQLHLQCMSLPVKILGTANNILDGLKLFKQKNPDIVFLDTEMQGSTGFDFLELAYRPDKYFIFITAYEKYAIKAIQSNVNDYLLKPLSADALQKSMEKAQRYFLGKKPVSKPDEAIKIIIHTNNGTVFKNISDVLYIKARNRYSEIFCNDGSTYIVCKNIGEYEADLHHKNFFRIHKSFLVNCSHVIKVNNLDGGFIEISGGTEIEISRRKKNDFIQFMRT